MPATDPSQDWTIRVLNGWWEQLSLAEQIAAAGKVAWYVNLSALVLNLNDADADILGEACLADLRQGLKPLLGDFHVSRGGGGDRVVQGLSGPERSLV